MRYTSGLFSECDALLTRVFLRCCSQSVYFSKGHGFQSEAYCSFLLSLLNKCVSKGGGGRKRDQETWFWENWRCKMSCLGVVSSNGLEKNQRHS